MTDLERGGDAVERETTGPDPEIDTRLLGGFRFTCRPDCGLCCYAAPALRAGDLGRLLRIAPEFRPEGTAAGFVPSRANGGACTFLAKSRCSVHSARPGPCAEFPLATHVGERIQVTLVFSCPGVGAEALGQYDPADRNPTLEDSLGPELDAVRRAVRSVPGADRERGRRSWNRALRVLRLEGAVIPAVRDRLRAELPMPAAEDLASVPVPGEGEGLERLPLFFDARYGRVALSGGTEGVELLVLREGGGIDRRLASFPYPDHIPRIGATGDRLLRGYLAYVLDRDGFIGAAIDRSDEPGEAGLFERCRRDLREVAASVMSRAVYRSWLDGRNAEELDGDAIADGIRATDADYLDRPTVGRWL